MYDPYSMEKILNRYLDTKSFPFNMMNYYLKYQQNFGKNIPYHHINNSKNPLVNFMHYEDVLNSAEMLSSQKKTQTKKNNLDQQTNQPSFDFQKMATGMDEVIKTVDQVNKIMSKFTFFN